MPLDVPLTDLSPQASDECAAELGRIIHDDAGRPFDLEAGPLVRVQLIKLEPDLHTLLFTTHHIVCDGWSTNVLLGELGQLYGAHCAGTACQLPAPMPFREYAQTQARWKQTPERAAVESWWAEKFAVPVSPLEFPTDRPRASVKSFHGDTVRRTIGAAAYQRIKRFGASTAAPCLRRCWPGSRPCCTASRARRILSWASRPPGNRWWTPNRWSAIA